VREHTLDDDASNISSCENLLESYFMQIDYLTNRLETLDEHVTSTEEQLTMELDHRRNELVAFDLFMTGAPPPPRRAWGAACGPDARKEHSHVL